MPRTKEVGRGGGGGVAVDAGGQRLRHRGQLPNQLPRPPKGAAFVARVPATPCSVT
eukprot:COSAG06_NODE_67461_length_252_cov_0.477124_2_plen_55_part_01